MPAKATDTIDLHVRLPRQLHERLGELAEARGLSLNTALILAAWDAVDSKPPTARRRDGAGPTADDDRQRTRRGEHGHRD